MMYSLSATVLLVVVVLFGFLGGAVLIQHLDVMCDQINCLVLPIYVGLQHRIRNNDRAKYLR